MTITRRDFSVGLGAGIGAPLVLGTAWAQGGSIKIGMCAPMTGAASESGKFAVAGARLAIDAVNKAGGVLGRPFELVVEDDQTTNPGIVLAFAKLAAQNDIVAFLGSIRSTQGRAMAPDVLKLGKPVMIGGTDPSLTHMDNQWLFRCRPSDDYSSQVIAEYGANVLGKKKWAVVHSTDAFGTAGGKGLAEALRKTGASTVLDQGYANQSQDFSSVALAIKMSGADIIGSYFTFENDLGVFARQLRQLGVSIPWIGSPSIVFATALKMAGAALYGTFGIADYVEDSSPAARAFAAAYRAAFGVAPDNQSSWVYDAVRILAAAANQAGSTEPGRLRDAILATRKFAGAEGEYNFDRNGDGLHGLNVLRNNNGNIVFERRIEFNDGVAVAAAVAARVEAPPPQPEPQAVAPTGRRVALVVGNSAYRFMPTLQNPKNDAVDVAGALKSLGFETVLATDLDRLGMNTAIDRFSRIVGGADVALIYYSGHGMQFQGKNYLLPIDVNLESAADVNRFRLTPVDDLIDVLSSAKGIQLLLLDACRNNPVERDFKNKVASASGGDRGASLSRGFSRIDTRGGLVITYATASNDVAADGDGRNSPFTKAFLKNVSTPDMEIRQMLYRVQSDVYASTGSKQLPEISSLYVGPDIRLKATAKAP